MKQENFTEKHICPRCRIVFRLCGQYPKRAERSRCPDCKRTFAHGWNANPREVLCWLEAPEMFG